MSFVRACRRLVVWNTAVALLLACVLVWAPLAAAGADVSCRPVSYSVQPGDTLSAIARRFHTKVAALARANSIDPNAKLLVGVVLRIPGVCTIGARSLASSLTAALAVPGVSPGRTGVVVVDLASSTVVFEHNKEEPLAPASTEKLPLALTALQRLGGAFRTRTDVLASGSQAGRTLRGSLVLKGYGDPTLTSSGLDALARAVRAKGIAAVTGGVIGDESYFDNMRTGPGWKPSFAKAESPFLSALVVDRGVLDGAETDSPALAASVLFARALERAGVTVGGRPSVGVSARGATLLARRASPPLAVLLAEMDTWSDNFIAEMLLKQIGARLKGAGITAAGAAAVMSTLADDDVPVEGDRFADGSGLSMLDRLSARTLAAILETIWHTPTLRPLVATFAVAGSTGTLRHRLLDVARHELVRGKTGTTDESSALVGFVGSRFAFVVLCNGSPVDWQAAHLIQDRVAETLLASAQ